MSDLPKAYLRLDPNIDQTRPDLADFVRLMCAANRQPRRGRFKTLDIVAAIVGRAKARRYVEAGDLVLADERYYLDGWDDWQEGDVTVGDRVRRLRSRRNSGVTEPLPQPLPNRNPPSEALGVRHKALDGGESPNGSSPPPGAGEDAALATYYQLTTRRPTKGALAWLNRLVGDWGDERVSRALALEWIESTDSSTLLSRTEALIASTAAAAQTDRRDAANARLLAEHRKLIEAPPPTNTAGMASLKRVLEEKGLS